MRGDGDIYIERQYVLEDAPDYYFVVYTYCSGSYRRGLIAIHGSHYGRDEEQQGISHVEEAFLQTQKKTHSHFTLS